MMKKDFRHQNVIAAKQLIDELMTNPEYLARMKEHEKCEAENRATYRKAASGVLADLATAGFQVQSAGDLVQQFGRDKVPYVEAIPVLLKWLPIVTHDALKDDIVRTLSVPWAKPAAVQPLLDEYVKVKKTGNGSTGSLRRSIGSALEVLADDSVFHDIVQIAEDRQYGHDREMIVIALGKMKNPLAVEVLIKLLDDEEVSVHAIMALGNLKAQEALPFLEPFLHNPKVWIRNETKKAIKKIERSNGQQK